jgi:hypothetical protein
MNFQRTLPVITSIVIILLVALLRDRSRVMAAVIATMPINVPLALWVVSAGSNGDSQVAADFMRATLISLVPSIIWLGFVYLAARAGWNIWTAMGLGYAVWGLLVAGLFYFGVLQLPR